MLARTWGGVGVPHPGGDGVSGAGGSPPAVFALNAAPIACAGSAAKLSRSVGGGALKKACAPGEAAAPHVRTPKWLSPESTPGVVCSPLPRGARRLLAPRDASGFADASRLRPAKAAGKHEARTRSERSASERAAVPPLRHACLACSLVIAERGAGGPQSSSCCSFARLCDEVKRRFKIRGGARRARRPVRAAFS